jgi:hypothetical protein
MRACLETIALDRIEERLHRLEDPAGCNNSEITASSEAAQLR